MTGINLAFEKKEGFYISLPELIGSAALIAPLFIRAAGAVADGVTAPVLRHTGAIQRAAHLPRRARTPTRGARGSPSWRAFLARPHGGVLRAVEHGGQGGWGGADQVVAGAGDFWKVNTYGFTKGVQSNLITFLFLLHEPTGLQLWTGLS